MKKSKLINSIVATTTVFGTACGALSSYSCSPQEEISILLSYNDGQTSDVTINDKSELLTFSAVASESTTRKIIIKSEGVLVADFNENNQLIPLCPGSTEVYAYFEDEPDKKSNSIIVTVESSPEQMIINDDNVVAADIFYQPGLPSAAVLSGFKADFAVTNPDDKFLIEKHNVVPSIRWEEDPGFSNTIKIANVVTNKFERSSFDVQIIAHTDLTQEQYSFYIDFTVDETTVITSRKMTLNRREMSYIVNDSTDTVSWTDNWRKIILTNFSTDANILSTSFMFFASFDSKTITEPSSIEITNKKFDDNLQLYTFDVVITWINEVEFDDDSNNFKLDFWINNIKIHGTKPYYVPKVKQVYYQNFGASINITDAEEPYLIIDLTANFVFTNEGESSPIVQAFWSQPVSAEQITPPKSITIQNIEPNDDGCTDFQVKFVWADRFDDSFLGSAFILSLTADGQPVKVEVPQFNFTWHYGITFSGSTSTTLVHEDGVTTAKVSKFNVISTPKGIDIDLVDASDFHWVGAENGIPEPDDIVPYEYPTELTSSFGFTFIWDGTFTISQEVSFTFDVIYDNQIIFNDFVYTLKPKSDDQYWDIVLEQTNATLTVETNTKDLIEVSVSNITPNSTLGTFYAKVDGQIAEYDDKYIAYSNNKIIIDPNKSSDFVAGCQITVGIEYYVKSQVITCDLNIAQKTPEWLGDSIMLTTSSGKASYQENKPVYFELDFSVLSSFFHDDEDIMAIYLFTGDLSSTDISQWDVCSCDLASMYCSIQGYGVPLMESMGGIIAFFPYIELKDLETMHGVFKFMPTQNFNDADVWGVFPI